MTLQLEQTAHQFNFICSDTRYYLLERGAFTFPLDNSTRAFTASFSRYISTLGGFGGPERTEKFSSIRADV